MKHGLNFSVAKNVLITTGLYIFLFSACNEASSPSKPEAVTTQPNAAAPQKLPAAPKFDVLEDKDISIGGQKRFAFNVLIEKKPISEEEIKAVSRILFSKKSARRPDEVTVWYYFDRSQSPGSYTLAMAEWTPKGDWSDVGLGSENVKHTFTKHVGGLVKDAPTPEERRIRKMMKDLFLETGGKPDKELAEILAPKLGKTPQEIMEINTKVALFDMGR